MKAQAMRWSAMLFDIPRTYSAQPVGVKTGDRVYQALPVDRFTKTKPVEARTSEPVMADKPRHVTVKRGDVLALKAQPGEYYWKLARRFAVDANLDGRISDREAGAYVKELIARNGGSSVIKPGQLLNLPVTEHSGYAVELAIAVQKMVQLRALFGARMPELDWGSVEVGPGPLDTYWLSFQEAGSEKRHRFLVSDDLTGDHPERFGVLTEREAREYFPL